MAGRELDYRFDADEHGNFRVRLTAVDGAKVQHITFTMTPPQALVFLAKGVESLRSAHPELDADARED